MVWQMRDAVFQGYAGAAFTHSSGGGLLEPADFHGMAALLIKDRVKGSKRGQQKALQRLMGPVKGNACESNAHVPRTGDHLIATHDSILLNTPWVRIRI